MISKLSNKLISTSPTTATIKLTESTIVPPIQDLNLPILPLTIVNQILTTLKSITSEIACECSILHNPFTPSGLYASSSLSSSTLTQKALHETESSKNDETLEARWSNKSVKYLIRRIPENAFEIMESRVAVVGNVDAGKSSLLGVLTKGRLDDGRGKARLAIFRHAHEVESGQSIFCVSLLPLSSSLFPTFFSFSLSSLEHLLKSFPNKISSPTFLSLLIPLVGRTSSVGMEILGFLPSGAEVIPEGPHGAAESLASLPRKQQLSWESISAKAAKVISFADLAGHG